MPKPQSPVDKYLAKLRPDQRAALASLRKTIRAAAPKAAECISYGVPAFREDTVLIGFGASKTHCAIYLFSGTTVEALQKDLVNFTVSKGTIRFLPEAPPSVSLIRKLVRARRMENAKRAGT